jgi:hypothetical protein
MQDLRVIFDDGGHWFAGMIVAEHLNDDTRTLIRVDDEFADPDGCAEFWVNNGYLYPENELEAEEL